MSALTTSESLLNSEVSSFEKSICENMAVSIDEVKSVFISNGMKYWELIQEKKNILQAKTNERQYTIACRKCGNNKPEAFVLDQLSGDRICQSCGLVSTESVVFEGDWTRNFEEDNQDNKTFGPAPDPNLSPYDNLSVTNVSVGGKGHTYNDTRNLIDISTKEKLDKKTTIIFKDRNKRWANTQLLNVCHALSIPAKTQVKAYNYFCCIRDKIEKIHKLNAVICFCLIIANRQDSLVSVSEINISRNYECKLCHHFYDSQNALRFHDCEFSKKKLEEPHKKVQSIREKEFIKTLQDDVF